MAFEPVINIWPGSSSYTTGSCPYGYYDQNSSFITDIDKFAKWAAIRLGYPIQNVELLDMNFYSAYEDAIVKYGSLVSLFNARDNLLNVSGLPTSSLNLSSQYIQPTLKGVFKLAKQYGTEVGSGGLLTYYTGSITLTAGQQVYNLLDSGSVNLERGDFNNDVFTIRKIFSSGLPGANVDIVNVYGENELLNQFGWANTSQDFMLMPLNYDLMRVQAIEFSDQIRSSAYTFQLTGNRLRIFPIPTADMPVLYFHYTLDSEILDSNIPGSGSGAEYISDISNIPYSNLNYTSINDLGLDWIKRYGLALCKEMLGLIRSKYGSIPFGDSDVTLNGDSLISSAQTDQENLITELKELLDSTSRQSQLERKLAEAESLQKQLAGAPLKLYIR